MTLLEVEGLIKRFTTGAGTVHALDGVSFTLAEGETLGLVGESGCGKSTLGRTVMRFSEPTAGAVRVNGTDISAMGRSELRRLRPFMQMIFQDPFSSLNPRKRVRDILTEPLAVHGRGNARERSERAERLFSRVGLSPAALSRYPHEFSGGQRQRIGIARALILDPRVLICDEAVSALDVSVRAQILNLLTELRRELNLSMLFISHDLHVVQYMSDRVAVMYLGRIVELAERSLLWSRPAHPYTQALIAAIPVPDPARRHRPAPLQGEPPSPIDRPAGCHFHPRCPLATDLCRTTAPDLRMLPDRRAVACHRAEEAVAAAAARH